MLFVELNLTKMLHIIVVFLLISTSRQNILKNEEENREIINTVLKAGEEYFKLTTKYSEMPVYGSCWRKPLEKLPIMCGNLTEDGHKLLALTFANCFLIQSHQKPHACVEPSLENVSKCFDMGMDDRVFSTYNNFYIHTHNMCYFLKNQMWQEETKKTVFQLMDASHKTVLIMESQIEIQNKIRQTQEETLRNGVQLRKEMDDTIEKSKVTLQSMVEEIRQSSGQQLAIFDEIAHQIIKLRALFFGELIGVYTVLYYFFVVIITYLLTSCKRLEDARMWLYILFTLSLTIEYTFANYGIEESVKIFSDQAQAIVYERVWVLRKSTLVVGVIVMIICFWRYRDYVDVVYAMHRDHLESRKEMLETKKEVLETKKEILELRQSLKEDSPIKRQNFKEDSLSKSFSENSTSVGSNTFVKELSPVPLERRASPYNLRERSRSPHIANLLATESSSAFAKTIEKSAKESKKNSILLRQQLKTVRRNASFTSAAFSSDED